MIKFVVILLQVIKIKIQIGKLKFKKIYYQNFKLFHHLLKLSQFEKLYINKTF